MNIARDIQLQINAIQRPQEITADLLDRFIKFADASPATMRTYSSCLKDFARYLNTRGITMPDRDTVIEYREDLKTRCQPATVQLRLVTVRLFFQWTAATGIYPDIAQRVKGPKISRGHKKDALDLDQLKQILAGTDQNTAQGRRDRAILLLMMTGGLRDVEIHRADIEDLRTHNGTPVLYLQGKGRDDKADFIKIVPEVSTALQTYLKERPDHPVSGPLFVSMSNNSSGRRLSTRSVSGIVKHYMRRAGYDSERLTAHSLRHSAVTASLKGGATLQQVRQFARHADISTTLIYAHDLEREKNPCEEIIAGGLFDKDRKEESAT